MKANKRQTADIFGVTQQAIDRWHSEGLPVEVKGGKGRESQYDTARVHTWLLERYKTPARKPTGFSRWMNCRQYQQKLIDILG